MCGRICAKTPKCPKVKQFDQPNGINVCVCVVVWSNRVDDSNKCVPKPTPAEYAQKPFQTFHQPNAHISPISFILSLSPLLSLCTLNGVCRLTNRCKIAQYTPICYTQLQCFDVSTENGCLFIYFLLIFNMSYGQFTTVRFRMCV